jgi:hypothetical protein
MSEQLNNGQPETSTKPSSKRFTPGEDTQICISWAATTLDSLNGSSQKAETLWGNILAHFNQYPCEEGYTRSAEQLESRWRIISRETSKWHAAMIKATDTKPSGYSDSDIVNTIV